MQHRSDRSRFLQNSAAFGAGLLTAGPASFAALAAGPSQNILVNGNMTIDDLNEGVEVACGNGMNFANTAASRWYVQFVSGSGGQATVQRVPSGRTTGSAVASKITVKAAAQRVAGMDRIQLFQPIEWEELLGYYYGAESSRQKIQRAIPLTMRFSIKTSIDLDIGCTFNNAVTTRNWTTSRAVKANEWTDIDVKIEPDAASDWRTDPFILYYQIGLSCGDTRLTKQNGYWNDGHALMIEQPGTGKFMMTEGATALITDCSLVASDSPDKYTLESVLQNRSRVLRYEEKSYPAGVRPGSPNALADACRFQARETTTEDRVSFLSRKFKAPVSAACQVYSAATGAAGMVYNATSQSDVPAQIEWVTSTQMGIKIPKTVPSHTYFYHWRVTTLV